MRTFERALGLGLAVTLFGTALAPAPIHARATSVAEAEATATALQLQPQEPEQFELKNGIRVYYLENERLPLVTVRAIIRAGAIWEPADRPGVASLTGRMMRAGGTETRSPDEMDEELDYLAAHLSSQFEEDQGAVTLNVLVDELEAGLAAFADVLRRPAFDASKMDVQKNLVKEEIRRENDSPIQAAFREYTKLIWGDDHPRARTPTEETVDALAREDLVAFHAAFAQPSNVMIGVAGDVSKKEIRKRLDAVLGDWEGPAVEFPEMPPAPEVVPRVALGNKSIPQSTVILGHLGPMETDAHRASGQVMMEILGSGGFTSYILDRVRNDEGLAYFAGGFLTFGRMDRGDFLAIALSKSTTTCEATDLILEQIERIQTVDVTDEELSRAVNGILNSQAFQYDSTQEIVANLMDLAYYDLPPDHDQRVVEEVGRISKADVKEAANALLHPSQFSMFVVGEGGEMDCAWSRYAEELGVELREIDVE